MTSVSEARREISHFCYDFHQYALSILYSKESKKWIEAWETLLKTNTAADAMMKTKWMAFYILKRNVYFLCVLSIIPDL